MSLGGTVAAGHTRKTLGSSKENHHANQVPDPHKMLQVYKLLDGRSLFNVMKKEIQIFI